MLPQPQDCPIASRLGLIFNKRREVTRTVSVVSKSQINCDRDLIRLVQTTTASGKSIAPDICANQSADTIYDISSVFHTPVGATYDEMKAVDDHEHTERECSQTKETGTGTSICLIVS